MSSTDEHLNWLAIQYVLGELSAADCEAFEQRLANDPIACEAVAAASRLILTTREALMESASHPILLASDPAKKAIPAASSPVSSRSSWMAFAGAVTAAGLVCSVLTLQTDSKNEDRSAAELVSLWRTGVPSNDSDSDDSDVELADTPSEAIPEWMLAAVSIQSEATFEKPADKVQEN